MRCGFLREYKNSNRDIETRVFVYADFCFGDMHICKIYDRSGPVGI